jgi:hypothetical protein
MAVYHTAGEELLFTVAKDNQHVLYHNTANINTQTVINISAISI